MSTNLKSIATILKKIGVGFQLDAARSCLYLLAKGKNLDPSQFCIIRVQPRGELLEIILPKLFEIKGQIFKGVFLQTLLTLQYEQPLIKFWYIPQQELVSATVELSLIDTPLTETNLMTCVNNLIFYVDETIPRLQKVLATGNDPGNTSVLEKVIAQMSPEAILEIEKLIAQRKKQN